MAEIGDQFIITIREEVLAEKDNGDDGKYYFIKGFDSLVFDDFGISKLVPLKEHDEELFHNGYVQGYQEGLEKAVLEDTDNYNFGIEKLLSLLVNEMDRQEEKHEAKTSGRFKVGDEVVDMDGNPCVVLRVEDGSIDIFSPDNGADFYLDPDGFRKTGRHFDQIDQVVKMMGGDR